MISQAVVEDGVSQLIGWWILQRQGKLAAGAHETMTINPFLAPILYEFHSADSFQDLAELLLAGHLMTGHNTGFGKLVDEKLLPRVFGTEKLDGKYRATKPFAESCFDNIDHLVRRSDGTTALLSLKSSRWTIQLGQAVDLNRAFGEIYDRHSTDFQSVVVGVIYGTTADLTDKYDILRGINRGKNHSVRDLTRYVDVLAGRDFWAWVNEGELQTQDWVMNGVLQGLEIAKCRERSSALLDEFAGDCNDRHKKYMRYDGSVDWHAMLKDTSG